jgi:hypothetical protein
MNVPSSQSRSSFAAKDRWMKRIMARKTKSRWRFTTTLALESTLARRERRTVEQRRHLKKKLAAMSDCNEGQPTRAEKKGRGRRARIVKTSVLSPAWPEHKAKRARMWLKHHLMILMSVLPPSICLKYVY